MRKCGGVSLHELRDMRDQLHHRGPDDKGCWVQQQGIVGFGHRRLSILDPTSSGHQPMHDIDAGLTIVFNGEVYNYLEIREQLKEKGHLFETGTDTEVILKAYLEWGHECLQQFNGMFAFAIWDEHEKELFIVRDRVGVKPLYYYQNCGEFYFASEVKAILAILPEQPLVQDDLIDSYMSFGYIPGSQTLHKGLMRLLPGHYMIVSTDRFSIVQYWDVSFDNSRDMGEKYYLENGVSLINSAIDLRLRSDVPLGIFLSGGIDSSCVVGLLAQRISEPLKTFSVAYNFGKQFNETDYARLVAEKFSTDHHEIFIEPQQFMDFIPEYIRLMDEPVTEAAAISLFFLSKLAKEQVTVVLSGEGSDEIFGGYDLYRYMAILEKYHKVMGGTAGRLIEKYFSVFLSQGNKIMKYLSLGSLPLVKRYKGISTYDESIKRKLYNKDFSLSCEQCINTSQQEFLERLFTITEGLDCLGRMLYFDTKTWLVDDLLIKADRMSMAASLELRVPFLDYRLVEFCAAMPSKYKIRGGHGKYLLKKIMGNILPEKIIHRKKMGFPTPLKRMFEDDLYGYAQDILLSTSTGLSRYFLRERIEEILQEHKKQIYDHHRIIWQLIVLTQWLEVNKSYSNCRL